MNKAAYVASSLLCTAALPVLAQTQATAPAATAEASAETFEYAGEIIVTAQKREQRISDVPMAISAYDGAFLDQIGATELVRIAQITPGVTLQLQDRLLPGISMRGITSDDTSPAAEPRAALFQDGVPITQIASAYTEMFDIDRVEVEKGPQSTLHGRSALNGGISVFQKMPTDTLGAEFKGGIGDHDYKLLQGVVNLPLSESFGIRVGALMHKQDGFLKDSESDATYNNVDSKALRLTARYAPTDVFSFRFAGTYDYDDTNSGGAFKSGLFVPLDQTTGAVTGDSRFWTPTHIGTFGDLPDAYSRRKVLGLSGTTDVRLGDHLAVTAITGYRWYTACQAGDIDGTPTNIIAYDHCNGGRQVSQEVRLNITDLGPFEGFVGASYFHARNTLSVDFGSDERAAALLLNGTLRARAPTGLTNSQINTLLGARASALKAFHLDRKEQAASIDTYDLFADGTVHITDRLEAFAGGRVTWDKKDVSLQASTPLGVSRLTGRGLLITSTPGGEAISGEHSSTLLTGRAGLRFVLNPMVNFYAVYGIGKRPEVLELSAAGTSSVTPEETLKSAEAGVKVRLFDGRLIGDASVYHYKYSNFQTTQQLNGVLVSFNAGSANATGVEAQANWRASEWLSLFGTFAYNHARFGAGAYEGNRFRNSPDTKFALGFTADAPLSVGTLSLSPMYSWQSKIFFSDDNDRTDLQVRSPAAFSDTTVDEFQKSYGLLSARLGFEPDEGNWSVAVIGDNLLDTKYIVDAGNTGDVFGMPTFVSGTRRAVRFELSIKL